MVKILVWGGWLYLVSSLIIVILDGRTTKTVLRREIEKSSTPSDKFGNAVLAEEEATDAHILPLITKHNAIFLLHGRMPCFGSVVHRISQRLHQ